MLFSVLTRKDKVPRHSSHPPRYPSLAKRRQISVGNSLTSGSSDSPSCHCWMSQGYPTQLALRLLRHPKGRSDPTDCNAGGLSLLSGPRDKDGGRLTTFSRPGPRLVGGLGESTEALQNTPQACSLGTLAQLLAQGWMSWRDSGKRPGSTSYLTLRLMATTPLLS